MKFIAFMASSSGRVLRAVAGLILIGVGVYLATVGVTTLGIILAVVGLVPLAAGVFDFCILAPLFGYPLQGTAVRQHH